MIQWFKPTTINEPRLFWILGWWVSPSTNHLATSGHLTALAISWVLHREFWLSNSASQGHLANDLVPSFWTFIYLIQHFWCGVLSLPVAIYHTGCSFYNTATPPKLCIIVKWLLDTQEHSKVRNWSSRHNFFSNSWSIDHSIGPSRLSVKTMPLIPIVMSLFLLPRLNRSDSNL